MQGVEIYRPLSTFGRGDRVNHNPGDPEESRPIKTDGKTAFEHHMVEKPMTSGANEPRNKDSQNN